MASKVLIDGTVMQSFIAAVIGGEGWDAGFQNGEVERAKTREEQVGGLEVCSLMRKALVAPGAAC